MLCSSYLKWDVVVELRFCGAISLCRASVFVLI